MTYNREWKLDNLPMQRAKKTILYYFYMTRFGKQTIRCSINDSIGKKRWLKGSQQKFDISKCVLSYVISAPFSIAMNSESRIHMSHRFWLSSTFFKKIKCNTKKEKYPVIFFSTCPQELVSSIMLGKRETALTSYSMSGMQVFWGRGMNCLRPPFLLTKSSYLSSQVWDKPGMLT